MDGDSISADWGRAQVEDAEQDRGGREGVSVVKGMGLRAALSSSRSRTRGSLWTACVFVSPTYHESGIALRDQYSGRVGDSNGRGVLAGEEGPGRTQRCGAQVGLTGR